VTDYFFDRAKEAALEQGLLGLALDELRLANFYPESRDHRQWAKLFPGLRQKIHRLRLE
jgi:hypothetical protein